MSANRAVLAAQRRRAGGPEPSAPGRPGPQPSINSAQMFSQQGQQQVPNQVRPGTNGRLAGQHAQLQQQQMQQQQQQQQQHQDHKEQGLAGVNKMTLAQAITLITLRLGKIETHLNEQDNSNSGIDSGIIDVIMSRLEELEGQTVSPTTNPNTNPNPSVEVLALKQTVDALKQQIDTFKPLLTQSKTSLAILSNEHKGFKQDIESIKAELAVLQNLTMEHNQQILQLGLYTDDAVNNNADGTILEDIVDVDTDNNSDIVGTDLKELIEQELNNA
jgi:hypothetical protein